MDTLIAYPLDYENFIIMENMDFITEVKDDFAFMPAKAANGVIFYLFLDSGFESQLILAHSEQMNLPPKYSYSLYY